MALWEKLCPPLIKSLRYLSACSILFSNVSIFLYSICSNVKLSVVRIMERSNSSILLLCDPDNLWRAVSAFLLCSNPGVGVHFNYKIHVINAILPLCSCPSGSFLSFHISLCFWAGVKVVRGVVVGYHGKQSGQRKKWLLFPLLLWFHTLNLWPTVSIQLCSRFLKDAHNTQPFVHPIRCLRRRPGSQLVRLPAVYVQKAQQCVAGEMLLSLCFGLCGGR